MAALKREREEGSEEEFSYDAKRGPMAPWDAAGCRSGTFAFSFMSRGGGGGGVRNTLGTKTNGAISLAATTEKHGDMVRQAAVAIALSSTLAPSCGLHRAPVSRPAFQLRLGSGNGNEFGCRLGNKYASCSPNVGCGGRYLLLVKW